MMKTTDSGKASDPLSALVPLPEATVEQLNLHITHLNRILAEMRKRIEDLEKTK